MTDKLTLAEMTKRGYVDIVGGNLPLDELGDEIEFEINLRNPSELVVIYDAHLNRATIYIPGEDFGREIK